MEDVPDLFREEVQSQVADGYILESVSEEQVIMMKLIKPSKGKAMLFVLISLLVPFLIILWFFAPAIPFYFFKGKRYYLYINNDNGTIDRVTG